jgi:hypothetical protein
MEVLTALLLTLLLLGLLSGLAVRQQRAGDILARRTEVVEARRVARDLLDAGVAGGGVRPLSGGAVELRSFVGWALPCSGEGWSYRGRRRPEPQRDSVWVVTAGGDVRTGRLLSVGAATCEPAAPGEASLALGFEADGSVALVRIFESGRYRLSDALRYGRTGDPAQPLTGAVLDPRASGAVVDSSHLTARVRGMNDSSLVMRRWRLR